MERSTKLVFHIPYYAWADRKLTAVDGRGFKLDFISHLQNRGVFTFYFTEAGIYYNGREYKEELMTIFCDEDSANDYIDVFERLTEIWADELRQEVYLYELNNTLVSF